MPGHHLLSAVVPPRSLTFLADNGLLYTCGESRHNKLCLEEIDDADNSNEAVPNQYSPKRVTAMNGFVVDNVACGGCHTLLTATKGSNADFTNNDFSVVSEETRLTSLTELPPLQKIPAMSKPDEPFTTEDVTNSNIEGHVNADNLNGNTNEETGSIDSLEANVSGSHIVNINDLDNENVSTHDIPDINKDEIAPSSPTVNTIVKDAVDNISMMVGKSEKKIEETIETVKTEVNDKVEIMETIIKKTTTLDPIIHQCEVKREEIKSLGIPDKISEIANSPPPKTPILQDLLHVPDLTQMSPVLSKHSDDGQKSEGGQSENETIPCGSDKSSPQAGKTKTQAVMPIVRSEDGIDGTEHNEESDVVVNKTPEKGRFARMFQSIKDKENSCMSKGKVIEEKVSGQFTFHYDLLEIWFKL